MSQKEEILNYLNELDDKFLFKISDLEKKKNENFETDFPEFRKTVFHQEKSAVLGVDIYKYSQYEEEKQKFIPLIFDIIFHKTIEQLEKSEKTFFGNFEENIILIGKKYIISTGDGGFVLFKEPFHAFLFNLYFYMSLHLFNTGHFYPRLSQYIGEIVIRSVITYDNIYSYEDNYYGKGIINNARILKKDRLNRFLIDKGTYDYFIKNFNGIESLQVVSRESLKDIFNISVVSSFIYRFNGFSRNSSIHNIHVQKIEDALSKDTLLTIYNIEIQIATKLYSKSNVYKISYILTIGNASSL